MKGLFLIGGCNFANNENVNVHKRLLEMSKKANPSLLYIHVSEKSPIYFINSLENLGFKVTLFSDLKQIENADIIFIGGGNTEKMILNFKKLGLIDLLIRHLDDKIIAGVSAGAIFWFKKYYSDTYAYPSNFTIYNYKMLDGIGYFDSYISPHFNEEGKENFSSELDGNFAIGLENNTALIITNNDIDYICDRRGSAIYYFLDGKMNLLTYNNKDVLKKHLLK